MMLDTVNACESRKILTIGAIFLILAAAFTLSGLISPAHAAKPTTYIVLDAASGQVLNEHGADELNYPASLTKMMTLFLTFDALERHQISLQTLFPVSRHASVQAPSKLGLVPGSTISVHDLILSVVTHSANDAAVVLAEGLAGSEDAFAVRMNREARFLGMNRTNFRNASGLPNRFQYTTARDLSKLALALYRTYPREYTYFSTESFTYRGETYGNHNHLMEAFQGMDGIKTGFINASGFNLAASAVRNNRRLVGVIMGGRSAASRDMEMAELLDDSFAHRGASAAMVASSEPPARRTMPLRRAEELSPLSNVVAAATPVPVSVPKAAPAPRVAVADLVDDSEAEEAAPPHRHHRAVHHAVAHRRHHRETRIVRVASRHHGRRHGIMLASYEREERAEPAHHHRHASIQHGHHRHEARAERFATNRNHRRGHIILAVAHRTVHHAQTVRLRHEHATRARHLVRATSEHGHGVACGGWAGHNQPCPQRLQRREALRSASLRPHSES